MLPQSHNHSSEPSSLSRPQLLRHYLQPHWAAMLLLALLLLGDITLQLLAPQLVRSFIDTATAGGAIRQLIGLASTIVAVTLVQQLVTVGLAYVGDHIGWRATNKLRTDLFARCLRADLRFHQRYTPGAMIERIDSDVGVLSHFLSHFVLLVIGNLLLLLGVLALLYREDWRLGLLFSAFALVAIYTFRLVEGKAAPYWEKAFGASADLYGFIEERLSGLDDLRANGALPAMMQHFYTMQRRFFQGNRSAQFSAFVIGSVLDLVLTAGTLAALALGIYLYQHNLLTLGGVYLITQYSRLIMNPLGVLSEQIDDLQKVGAALTRINQLWRTSPMLTNGSQEFQPQGAVAIEFASVTFSYPLPVGEAESVPDAPLLPDPATDRAALQTINFRLAPGRVLGLLGRTGSGKTTLTRLLFRFYDPTHGVIQLNDIPLPELDIASLRRQIGLVTQDVQIFDGTLRENLTFFDDRIPDREIITALQELGLEQWLHRFPDGLNTRLGVGGQGISAGEAQLLALTRVLLKNARLIILDEASARLDVATEGLIEQAIGRLLQKRTAIIIAHRLATVKRVDEIMILAEGRIREKGDRALLAADPNSYYAKLLATDLQEVLA